MPVVTLTKQNSVLTDHYVYEGQPATNQPANSTLQVKGGMGTRYRSLVQFDLGLIPNDAIINSATLELYLAGTAGGTQSVAVHKNTSPWSAAVTWNTQPTFDSTPVSSLSINDAGGYKLFDVKALVQEWVNGQANNGFMVKALDENIDFTKTFSSSEAASNQPRLTIDYTIPSTGKKCVEYVGAGNGAGATTSSLSVPFPTGLQDGDLLIMKVDSVGVPVPPAGWTTLLTNKLYYKRYAAGDGTSVNLGQQTSAQIAARIFAFRNVKAVETLTNGSGSGTSHSPPAISVAGPKRMILLLMSTSSGPTFTLPKNYATIPQVTAGSYVIGSGYGYLHEKTTQASTDMTVTTNTSAGVYIEAVALEPYTNNPPTITLSSPTDNQILVEGNIYEISGTASETDVGNVVTVKYKIDDGQTYNITAGVSDGTTPINFNKSLTYLNNRLYDGQTPVTPILDDQVPHTLKVWAEDDQGGKSTEETRNFTVLYNQPPQISGQDEDLGTITEPPSIQYSVTDIEGYAFTIKEAVDGNTIRTFPGVDGQQETVTIPQDMWIRLQPGVTHSLTITATDQYGATSTRTFTFIRTVDGIELMTTTILPADEQPSRVILSLNGSIPSNANLNIQVCNNAHDPSPTWEDMTDSVKNKRPYVFTNTTSTTGQWGIQFKISIMPGA